MQYLNDQEKKCAVDGNVELQWNVWGITNYSLT